MRYHGPGILSGLILLARLAPSQAPQPAPAGAAPDTYSYSRQYKPGEVDTYEVRVRDSDSGGDLVGVSEHRVFVRDGVPTERVRWTRLTESKMGDLSDLAVEVPAYEMSLDPRGELRLSDVKGDPVMLEMVSDLYEFYFAISPGAGIGHLRRAGDHYERPDLVSRDWADGDEFLVGRSRSRLRLGLVSVAPDEVVYQADFVPPAEASLGMERAWMEAPACGSTPNNAEFVLRQPDGFLVSAGCEKSQITSRVEPATGKLLAAFLDDEVTWNRELCRDEALHDCRDLPPLTRHRVIELRLRPPAAEQLPPDRVRVNPRDGLEYTWIPPGEFVMGCVPGDDECYPEERPAHAVKLTHGFWLGRTEVPVQAYERFVRATGRDMPEEPGAGAMPGYNDGWRKKSHPMVKVTWEEAGAFCRWSGGRLPTEAEWEYAARGGVAGLKYPWGNDRSHDQANYWRTGGTDRWLYTAPVGSFPPNAYGLYDMAGNVYEWVGDWFSETYYEDSPLTDPGGPVERAASGGARWRRIFEPGGAAHFDAAAQRARYAQCWHRAALRGRSTTLRGNKLERASLRDFGPHAAVRRIGRQ